jgi:hypothetical protein
MHLEDLRNDVAVAGVFALSQVIAPVLRLQEQREFAHAAYEIVRSLLESYDQYRGGRLETKPSVN